MTSPIVRDAAKRAGEKLSEEKSFKCALNSEDSSVRRKAQASLQEAIGYVEDLEADGESVNTAQASALKKALSQLNSVAKMLQGMK